MNVSPGSAFFQTVQGSAANTGAHSGGGAVKSVQETVAVSSSPERQRSAPADIQLDRQLRAGPPGTNLNIVV